MNPYRGLADLTAEDQDLVVLMAKIVADMSSDIDDRQAALDTLIEVITDPPIEIVEMEL